MAEIGSDFRVFEVKLDALKKTRFSHLCLPKHKKSEIFDLIILSNYRNLPKKTC